MHRDCSSEHQTQDTVRAEIGYGSEKSIAKTVVKNAGRRDWFDGGAQEDAQRLEGRRVFGELERVVSCCNADRWWRTKLNFSRGEPFDDLHRATTLGTAPKIGEVFGGGSVLFGLRLLYRAEQLKTKRQKSGTLAVGQESEVTDAHEALWKDMQ